MKMQSKPTLSAIPQLLFLPHAHFGDDISSEHFAGFNVIAIGALNYLMR